MTHTHKELFEIISTLPPEKLNIAMAFIRFLEQQKEPELFIDTSEENEL